MKTASLLILATLATLLASCASGSGSASDNRRDSMPGMTAEEHAKMKH